MKTFDQKVKIAESLKDKFSKAKIAIFTSFARTGEKGLTVEAMNRFRKDLRTQDGEYVVEKKTLLDRVLKAKHALVDVFGYEGSLGTVFGYGDESAITKLLYQFSKQNSALKYHGALLNGQLLNAAEISEFAKLPSREVLLAQAVGMTAYPLRGLATVLQANIRGFLSVLSQIQNKK